MGHRQENIAKVSAAIQFVIETGNQDYPEQAQINNRKDVDLELLNKLFDAVLPFTADG